ncbi:tRNASer (uridine44-2'-O)-methyltransferase, partial [Phenoliferia sp. Uapishka_3]
MSSVTRVPFSATRPSSSSTPSPLPSLPSLGRWQPILETTTTFSRAAFDEGLRHLVLHPEYNSSTILRADVLHDSEPNTINTEELSAAEQEQSQREVEMELEGYTWVRRVRRKILPNRKMDSPMEEECLFFAGVDVDGEDVNECLLLLRPDLDLLVDAKLPYYYPQVAAIAFRYCPSPPGVDHITSAVVRIEFVSLPNAPLPEPVPLDHRLYRTALGLLKQLCQVSAGVEQGYVKRVNHDLLAGKEEVQDLYMVLKEKYRTDIPLHSPRITFRWMLREWKESTDPQKHLWEDVAIASFLIVLWKSMYPETGRPSGGFVDVGCGNGLLVFILSQEGYTGYGVDLRARKSWPAYRGNPDLRVQTIDPITLISTTSPPFPANSFLIGNHADEMSPWIPLFAASSPGAAFLNIPCCLHELSGRFTTNVYRIHEDFLQSLPLPPAEDATSTLTGKNQHPLLIPFYAPSPSSAQHESKYIAYQLYLAHLTLQCGFIPEREALRIPSTKNFGMVGKKRVWEGTGKTALEVSQLERQVSDQVQRLVASARGSWVARVPEGKAGEGSH